MMDDRRTGIGGSDIGAIVGLSPWRSPLDVYLAKRGESRDDHRGRNEDAMYWGTALEDVVAREYARRTGRSIQRVTRMLRHPTYDFAIAHIDRAVGRNVRWRHGRLSTDRILEVKTSSAYASDEWGAPDTDEIPAAYIAQCQWYMAVTGADITDVAVLIGGSDYRAYRVTRDDRLIASLMQAGVEFWERVQAGEPPGPRSVADAESIWPRHDAGKSVIVDATIAEACAALEDARKQRKYMDAREEELRLAVMAAIGDAEEACYMGRRIATWKTQEARRIDISRLKRELPDIAARFTVSGESRVFRVCNTNEEMTNE